MEPGIKHRIRDVCVFLLSIFGIAFLYRLCIQKPLVRVIAFHDVADREWFETVIRSLSQKFAILTPDEFHAGVYRRNKINVLVTFDDGYRSWIDLCAPVLAQYKIKALFFVNSGLLNDSHSEEKTHAYMKNNLQISPKAPLTWDDAKKLVAEGHVLGGHTVHHRSLRNVPLTELVAEVQDDKRTIESEAHVSIIDFAYPFGISRDFSSVTEKKIRDVGYTHIYTAEPGFVTALNTHIPRTLIEKKQPPQRICRWIYGSYDLFSFVRKAAALKKKAFMESYRSV